MLFSVEIDIRVGGFGHSVGCVIQSICGRLEMLNRMLPDLTEESARRGWQVSEHD